MTGCRLLWSCFRSRGLPADTYPNAVRRRRFAHWSDKWCTGVVRHSSIALTVIAFLAAGGIGEGFADENVPPKSVEGETFHGDAVGRPAAPRQTAAVGGSAAPAQEAAGRTLDLSLPPEALEPTEPREHRGPTLYRGLPGLEDAQAQNDLLRTMRRALPALLAPTTEDNPVRIKGRLLMDQTQERSPTAVDGGQLIIEVQTD